MDKSRQLSITPKRLQQYPSKYLDKLINTSKERIRSLLQGGHTENKLSQVSTDEATIRHISCYEGYVPKHPIQGEAYDTARLQGLINRNKHKGSAYCMKIMGLATYAAHKWQDRAFLRKKTKCVAIPIDVSVKLNYCKTGKLTGHFLRIPLEDL